MITGIRLALLMTIGSAAACPVGAQEPGGSQSTTFDQTFFATTQASDAYEMALLLPGFSLEDGDSDVRGYAGAAGNVLIDGQRPAGKTESVETILKRIPAARIARVELITAGSTGYDMQGYAVLANFVLIKTGAISGQVAMEQAVYRHGARAPSLSVDTTLSRGDRVIELSLAALREIDDEHGFGSRNRISEDGRPLRLAKYSQPEGADTLQAKLAYRQPFAGGTVRLNSLVLAERKFADIGYASYYPEPDVSSGTERKHTRTFEGGFDFARPIGSTNQLELLGSYRSERTTGVDRETEGLNSSQSDEISLASEAIARAAFRHTGARAVIEAGAEGAINVLDSDNALLENDAPVIIPQASVRVAERRAELFATASGPLVSRASFEVGLRYEMSRITQTSDIELGKSIAFLKPRLRLTWEPAANQTLRFLVERQAGQLDFSDFVGAASLTSGTISAGNADLQPESWWRLELSYDRRFGDGSIVTTVRREWLSDAIDQLPLVIDGITYDAVGNIGSARRDEFETSLKWPLEGLGAKGVIANADLLARRTRARDPSTGNWRPISGEAALEARISVTHDIPAWKLRWGANFAFAQTETSFKIREIESERLAERLDLFIEYRPRANWMIRLFGKNLTDSPATRIRDIYGGIRGGSALRYRELRILRSGPYVGLSVQHSFGG